MEKETKTCPYCGEEIQVIAKKCRYCGEWLPEESAPKKMIPCPICGEEIEEGTDTCPYCGEKVLEDPRPVINQSSTTSPSTTQSHGTTSQTSKKNNSAVYILIAAIVAVIVILGIVLASSHNDTSNENINNENSLSASEMEVADNAASDVTESQWAHWEKGYFKNDYGEDNTSAPYIKQEFNGESDRGECKLEVSISDAYGIIFSILGRYVDFVDCTVKAKTGNQEYILNPTSTNETSIIFQDGTEIQKILSLLECGDFFKLAINNSDAANQHSSFTFEILGKTNVTNALSEIGVGQNSSDNMNQDNSSDENTSY